MHAIFADADDSLEFVRAARPRAVPGTGGATSIQ